MHAHVGFIARGHIAGEYADGCTFEFVAPQVVTIEPGHDAWVLGDEAAVLIQFDSEEGTARRFGLPEAHTH
jgi:streptogramin lyase